MSYTATHVGNLRLLGGELCLDFANTADWHASDQPQEWLTSSGELVAWSQHVGILSERDAVALRERAGVQPEEAGAAYARAITLREAIYRIFSAVSAGTAVAID